MSKFDDLRRKKEYEEKRDLPLKTISQETGLAVNTIQRVRHNNFDRVAMSTLDKLCAFFGVSTLCELIEYVPGEDAAPKSS